MGHFSPSTWNVLKSIPPEAEDISRVPKTDLCRAVAARVMLKLFDFRLKPLSPLAQVRSLMQTLAWPNAIKAQGEPFAHGSFYSFRYNTFRWLFDLLKH